MASSHLLGPVLTASGKRFHCFCSSTIFQNNVMETSILPGSDRLLLASEFKNLNFIPVGLEPEKLGLAT